MTRSVDDWGEALESHPIRNTIAVIAMVLAVLIGIGFVAQGSDFFLYKVFAPKYEEVRRETFEESQAHVEGVNKELTKLQMDYASADSEAHRCAIRAMAIRTASTNSHLPEDLTKWVKDLKEDSSCN
ncbi:MAG: hypothetical protein ABIF06_00915 [bacterium]